MSPIKKIKITYSEIESEGISENINRGSFYTLAAHIQSVHS